MIKVVYKLTFSLGNGDASIPDGVNEVIAGQYTPHLLHHVVFCDHIPVSRVHFHLRENVIG